MGAGKTEVGRKLAAYLGRTFLDTDRMVERLAGKSIPEIFKIGGEAGFRAQESEAVRQAVDYFGAVIACGGGVVVDPMSVRALQRSGMVIYLKVRPEEAAARVGAGDGRPLLEGRDALERLRQLIQDRGPAYEKAADRIIEASGTVEDVLAAILTAIDKAPPQDRTSASSG